jgi:hypothetical protein
VLLPQDFFHCRQGLAKLDDDRIIVAAAFDLTKPPESVLFDVQTAETPGIFHQVSSLVCVFQSGNVERSRRR